MKLFKKITAILLCAAVMLAALPLTCFAAAEVPVLTALRVNDDDSAEDFIESLGVEEKEHVNKDGIEAVVGERVTLFGRTATVAFVAAPMGDDDIIGECDVIMTASTLSSAKNIGSSISALLEEAFGEPTYDLVKGDGTLDKLIPSAESACCWTTVNGMYVVTIHNNSDGAQDEALDEAGLDYSKYIVNVMRVNSAAMDSLIAAQSAS